ncbi:MAG: NAD(P)-dependent oxidoreductase [Phycisphaerales bacterium]
MSGAAPQLLPSGTGLALVTGGLGFVGSNTAIALAQQGWRVRVADTLDPACGGSATNLRGVPGTFDVQPLDVSDQAQCDAAVQGAQLVVHCAASISHGRSVREPLADIRANCVATACVLDAVRRLAPEATVVHVSTTTQSGPLARVPADLRAPDAPIDVYSANRLAAERYAVIAHMVHGLRTVAVRLPNLYGPRACITSAQLTFNNWFIGCALRNQPITIWGDGAQRRSIMHVDDAVRALLAAAAGAVHGGSAHGGAAQAGAAAGRVLLATPRGSVSVAEFAHAVVRAAGQGRVEFTPWPAGRKQIDVGDAEFDPSETEQLLNWRAQVPLDEGLRRTVEHFRAADATPQ